MSWQVSLYVAAVLIPLAAFAVDVKLARMLIAAKERGALREMIVIASFLGLQDPRERPQEAREAADRAHAAFADERSEFVSILKLWDAYRPQVQDYIDRALAPDRSPGYGVAGDDR